ncbi:60S ribosomal protein L13 [Hondaea fermentalgiana]|uniref:60S ribosomal protein L13 n=1 Tax=Hondaea fermentalgiana TaxID=2315210 RepID=A0A2R5G9E1_9STRA|nr:60S ribosomal protein L13 [Hondaea fermentalgiana]|eukprot:GBG27165.1 60S ribosomal protein L13 [Hondaea fermentalgiana]
MVKHNNVVPNQHFKKHGAGGGWQSRVRVTLDQPARKLRRRLARKAKAERVAPRPVNLLRPAVHCPTQRYNMKLRAGRGFTLDELKEAGISAKQARTIGIAVDTRRRNKSVESLQLNAQRLKEYKSRLIVFPRKSGKVKKGDSSIEETKAATQLQGEVMPITQPEKKQEYMEITEDMKKESAVYKMKMALAVHRLEGKKRFAKAEEEEDK